MHIRLKEIMTPAVETIRPESTLREAAEKMRSLDVGSLPVYDNRELKGMITDRDITIRAIAAGRDPSSTKVSDVMSSEVIYCFEDQSVEEGAQVMEQHQIRRLLILSRDHQLVGIVSLGDLAVRSTDDQISAEVLEEVSEPTQRDQ
jgi:CBS domain-containing protein